jgi:prefoldin subunit 5
MQEDLQQQLQAMRAELSELEADLASRDREAADLSRALADARTMLGDGAATPYANGSVARGTVRGSMVVRIGARGTFFCQRPAIPHVRPAS